MEIEQHFKLCRRQDDVKGVSKSLNANAAEFTPSGPGSYKTTPSVTSQTEHSNTWWPQFGDLPESLNASPHQSIQQNRSQHPEWTADKYANYAANGNHADYAHQVSNTCSYISNTWHPSLLLKSVYIQFLKSVHMQVHRCCDLLMNCVEIHSCFFIRVKTMSSFKGLIT